MQMEKSDEEEEDKDEDEKDMPIVDLTGSTSETHPTSAVKSGRVSRVFPKIACVKEEVHAKPYR